MYDDFASKSIFVASLTVSLPVLSIAKAFPTFPAVIANAVTVSPGSGSAADTVPTIAPFVVYSGTEKLAAVTIGASFTGRTVNWNDLLLLAPPGSVTVNVIVVDPK